MLHPVIFSLSILSVSSLSPFLDYYEPLNYNTPDQARVSRSAQSDQDAKIEFDAFNRTFKLRLRKISREESVFLKDAVYEFANETLKIDELNFYKGSVEGDDHSRVAGTIRDGIFVGGIQLGNGREFENEYSARFNSSVPFHSFIYDAQHINMPKKIAKRSDGVSSSSPDSGSSCALSDPKIAESIKVDKSNGTSRLPRFPFRSTREAKLDPTTKLYDYRWCTISFQIDHTLYNHYFTKFGGKDEKKTTMLLYELVQRDVQRVNEVYSRTDFNGVKGVQFSVKGVQIFRTRDDPKNIYKSENVDVEGFLRLNGQQDLGDVCLGYAMTYRDFAGGTVGLAYKTTVCAVHHPHSEYQKSANAGMVTFLNHGSAVLERTSYLTLAHEIGHNFGSDHDGEKNDCTGEDSGNEFIMHPAATSGDKPNNREFSRCSIKQMAAKLHEVMKVDPAKPTNRERNCFVETGQAVCGNGITEKGEECDCGYDQKDCDEMGDACCYPASDTTNQCKLKPNKQCAPSQGPCCDASCTFKAATEMCKKAGDCTQEAFCAGAAACPDPAAANPDMPCNDASGACTGGVCNATRFCVSAGLEDCDSGEQTCMRYCKKDGKCQPTSQLDEFKVDKFQQKGRWGHLGVMLGPRSLCMGGKGTCNQIDVCKKVQVTGSLSRNMGEVVKGFASFGDLLIKKIWVLILLVIGIAIILVVVIKFCSYATPSSNPNKPKAKSIKQIKNMMSNRAKKLSQRVRRKKGEKGAATPTTPGTAQTPVVKSKTKEGNEEDDS